MAEGGEEKKDYRRIQTPEELEEELQEAGGYLSEEQEEEEDVVKLFLSDDEHDDADEERRVKAAELEDERRLNATADVNERDAEMEWRESVYRNPLPSGTSDSALGQWRATVLYDRKAAIHDPGDRAALGERRRGGQTEWARSSRGDQDLRRQLQRRSSAGRLAERTSRLSIRSPERSAAGPSNPSPARRHHGGVPLRSRFRGRREAEHRPERVESHHRREEREAKEWADRQKGRDASWCRRRERSPRRQSPSPQRRRRRTPTPEAPRQARGRSPTVRVSPKATSSRRESVSHYEAHYETGRERTGLVVT
ncbi:MAG: hypothetical protein GY738_12215, partial [Pseudoalteromonas sp.]|nr:hypothetical protein [Pseudoalteromonas sp.]